jgi:uncharacterized protein (TIGR03437 family)
MRSVALSLLVLCAAAPWARGTVINIGPTNQKITFTGLGPDASGRGSAIVTWGSCVPNGSTNVCTVTAPFTGLGGGGTVTWVLTYSGNGPSPVTITYPNPSSSTYVLTINGGGSMVQTLTENNGTTVSFYFTFIQWTFSQPQCTLVTVCDEVHVASTANATITGVMSGTSDLTPIIGTSGVISAGSFGAFKSIAPATWIEIYGYNLGMVVNRTWGGADFNGNSAPTGLGGTTVTIGGLPAYIDYVNPDQVNAQVPSGVGTGFQPVVVTTAGGSSLAYSVLVNPIQPGLLAPPVFQINGTQYLVALYPDGVTYVLPPGITNAVPTRRAKPGDTILLYGVGFGPVMPSISAGQIEQQSNSLASLFQISFGGVPAKVSYFGLTPTFVGLYQFNVIVPNVEAGDKVPVGFSVGSTNGAQSLAIAIGN